MPTSLSWVPVAAGASPFIASVLSPKHAVDLRAGPVTVRFWLSPADGLDAITIKDTYNLSSQAPAGAGMPGGPITIDGNGKLVEDPSHPGTYSATGKIADPGGFTGSWRYSAANGAWLLESH